ncbi:asparaginase [Corynebacterium terpenotabidum]|uniref:asparaginase n=1 Tax=Corynebacterium terpenotabidum Y-11 TaxID=1200352 RepID=S4XDG8_9CORY|nr:asparaginase [Corynebacterium terpenotabidum]AGP30596.1 L-asparaginase [Corynebacterium terpenotabidum Y-11]
MSQSPPVTLLATGGTIACTSSATGTLVPTRTAGELVRDAGLSPGQVTAHDALHLDSSEMTLADLDQLLREIRGATGPVIVTHGTDSMEETAMAVDRLLGGPVILTGAQRPADDPAPDGPGNLRDAVCAAASATTPVVVMGGAAVPAYGVRKVHTTADGAFGNPGIPRPGTLCGGTPPPLAGLRVDIIMAYQGADASLVDAAVAAGAHGLVIAGFGSGNAGGLTPGVRRALDAGLPVVLCTRVPGGPVDAIYGGDGGGATLAALGARSGGLLSPPQARMELLCQLAVARRANPADQR